MEKLNEIQLKNGFYIKTYRDAKIKTIIDLIEEIKGKVKINYISIKEDVELEQQSYSGLSFSAEELKNTYSSIASNGRDLSYFVNAILNDSKVTLKMEEGKSDIAMITDVSSLELDSLLPDKKPDTLSFQ